VATAPGKASVLLLTRSLEVGGAERQLVALATGLHQRGHRVAVVVFYLRGPLADDLRAHGVPIVDLRKTGRWEIFGFFARYRRAVHEFRPGVVYSFLGGANIVAALARRTGSPGKLVWSIRASDMDLAHYDWTHRAADALETRLSRTPRLIIANSNAGRDFAIGKGFAAGSIAVVPNGIDTQRFRPDPALRMKQRRDWGIPGGDVTVGVLARLDPMKDHATFLRAAALLRSHPIRFLCIGEGPEQPRLRRLAAELGLGDALMFTGHADPLAALNAIDIACSSSRFGEGFSNAVGEAMACEVPCVVTDVGDSRSIVGDTGIVVPRERPDELAAALLELISDRRERGRRARKRIVANYSVRQMVERTEALLEDDVLRPTATQ
jgi:glycosyltransferase involved in cell wall biosynthesis